MFVQRCFALGPCLGHTLFLLVYLYGYKSDTLLFIAFVEGFFGSTFGFAVSKKSMS
jgi:hypothetical protein